jgi:hypothetical protein
MAQTSFLTPYKSVNVDVYGNPPLKKQGEILLNATTFRFDGSDLMPGKIGAGAFWTGMVDFVGGKVLGRRRGRRTEGMGLHQVRSGRSDGGGIVRLFLVGRPSGYCMFPLILSD